MMASELPPDLLCRCGGIYSDSRQHPWSPGEARLSLRSPPPGAGFQGPCVHQGRSMYFSHLCHILIIQYIYIFVIYTKTHRDHTGLRRASGSIKALFHLLLSAQLNGANAKPLMERYLLLHNYSLPRWWRFFFSILIHHVFSNTFPVHFSPHLNRTWISYQIHCVEQCV